MPEASIHEACRRGDLDAVRALPDDTRYTPITESLRRHQAGG